MAESALHRDEVNAKQLKSGHVLEAPRRLRIRHDVDVLVCGGGPAGVGAALAAAAEGAHVLLVERYGMLGGVWTAGLLNPFFECMGRGWVVDDLVGRLNKAGAMRPWMKTHTFDVEVMRRTLEAMMLEAGVDLLYYTLIADAIVEHDRVRGVVVESKSGREAITARTVIDATGDGDVAARAGCAYELGRSCDHLLQPMTLMFEVTGLGQFEHNNARVLYDAMQKAMTEHGLNVHLPFGRVGYAPWIINTPNRGDGAIQATHVYRMNSLDPSDLTRGTIECRRQAEQMVEVLKHVPGLTGIRITHSAAQIGVREARRIRGKYHLGYADLKEGRRFDDAVAACGFVVDIHDPSPKLRSGRAEVGGSTAVDHGPPMRPYEIPYRCLLPEGRTGLLTAGRCISGSHEAHASYRVTGTAMATGQGAGLAAAWAQAEGVELDSIPGSKLKRTLMERGAAMADTLIPSV